MDRRAIGGDVADPVVPHERIGRTGREAPTKRSSDVWLGTHVRVPACLAVIFVAAAGCVGDRSHLQTFDEVELPTGWTAYGGTWRIVNASSAGSVLSGQGDKDPGLSSLVNEGLGKVKGFDLRVELGLLSGADPQGAGVVFDWVDERNYVIVRYSTHEHGWHLFTVIDGERTKEPNATTSTQTDPGFNVWMDLRVTQRDGRVEAFHDETQVIDFVLDDRAPREGFVGVFVRGDSRAYFDDVRVDET